MSADRNSNFQVSHRHDLEHWRRLPYSRYEHVEVSDFGGVRNVLTRKVYTPYTITGTRMGSLLYVNLAPAPGTTGRRAFPVGKLVYEAWHNVELPRGRHPDFANGDYRDMRLVNLSFSEPDAIVKTVGIKKYAPAMSIQITAGEVKKAHRSTRAETEHRITKVAELIAGGFRRSDILRYVAEKTDWNLTDRQIDKYISRATEYFKELSKVDREAAYGEAIYGTRLILAMALNTQDLQRALAARKELHALQGLYVSAKSVSDGDDE